jgi:peroxiredoxin
MTEGPFGRREGPAPPAEPTPEPAPPRAQAPAPRPSGGLASSVTWILGVVLIVFLAVVTINTIRTTAPGSKGLKVGSKVPPFAAPLVTGSVQGDATVAIKARDGHPKACDVRGDGIFNVCEAAAKGPLVLAFLADRSDRCLRQIDLLERMRPRFSDVQFAAVAIRGDRAQLRREVREHGWTMPIAYDADGAVANTYAVAVCPTITFAARDGVVKTTTLGEATEAEIARDIALIR